MTGCSAPGLALYLISFSQRTVKLSHVHVFIFTIMKFSFSLDLAAGVVVPVVSLQGFAVKLWTTMKGR